MSLELRPSFSFTDWSTYHPADQQPGDRLDAEFVAIRRAIVMLAESLDAIAARPQQPDVGSIADEIRQSFASQLADVGRSASMAFEKARDAKEASATAVQAAAQAEIAAKEAAGEGVITLATLRQMQIDTQASAQFLATTRASVTALQADVLDGAGSSEEWAVTSWHWAEYMDGPLPADTIAFMGITGDHWSSRWWANQASIIVATITDDAQQASDAANDAANSAGEAGSASDSANAAWDDFNDVYLGVHPTAPTTDNDGDPLQQGALYYDSGVLQMRVWDGSTWTPFSGSTAVIATDVTSAPNAPQGIAATNVQAYLDELAAERLRDAPSDGAAYARKDGVWSPVGGNVAWTDITGKPSTFPPSAHTHAMSEVTGLTAALGAKADASALSAEVVNRQNADTTLQGQITTEVSDRQAADTTLTTNLNAEISNRIADVDAEETARIAADNALNSAKIGDAPSDGKQYARSNGAWAQVIGGATVSDAPPASPLPNSFWYESDSGALWLRYTDVDTTQWIQVNYVPSLSTFVQKAGDTMTGNLVIDPASGVASVSLDAVAGNANALYGARAGLNRWAMSLGSSAAESGSNAGSDFALTRCDDTGAAIDTPLLINRKTGYSTFAKSAFVGGSAPPSDPTNPMLFGAVSLTRTLEFNSYVNGGLRRANATGFLGILDLNPATGVIALNTSNASVAAGADSASAMAQRMEWRANGITYSYGRMIAIDGPFNANLAVYSPGLASAFCWTHTAAGRYGLYSADSAGAPVTGYAVFDTSGVQGMGNQRALSFYTNGASTVIWQYHTNYYQYLDMATGHFNYVQNGTGAMQNQMGGVFDVINTNASKGTAGSWVARSSDERVKQAIRDYTSGLAEILRLRPRWFQYKPETHEMHVGKDVAGFVAQEMQEAMPDCVIPSPIGEELGELKVPGMLSVDITNVTYALINSIKELNARIQALEAGVATP